MGRYGGSAVSTVGLQQESWFEAGFEPQRWFHPTVQRHTDVQIVSKTECECECFSYLCMLPLQYAGDL